MLDAPREGRERAAHLPQDGRRVENRVIENRPQIPIPPGCDPASIVLTFPVAREHAGQRLDRFIQRQIPRLSRTRANEIVRACAYEAEGRKRRPSERVRYGEIVLLIRPPLQEPETPQTFGVLYEDEDVFVVDKPPGLPMHPTATYHKNTLTYLLRERYGPRPPHICHRLDRETSGIVVCAKNRDAERTLKQAFENRQVEKRYVAIARGTLSDDEGLMDVPLGRATTGLHVLMETRPAGEGLPAVTRYRVVGRRGDATLVELEPETGRQHQLRVHLSHVGHPIFGDKLYGPEGARTFLDYIDQGMTDELRARLGHDRHALHAQDLSVAHPRTGALLSLHAPMPADMVDLWKGEADRDAAALAAE
jgi:23S rRNA pseudouridine1911/1915/1917 synthase